MDEREWLTERFEQNRPRLRAVAYRMLGSVSETDDALQEAWLRIRDQDPETVENMQAWLTTVVGRVCLNMLRSRRARREEPSVHVPDPVVSFEDDGPEHEALVAESVGLAMLVVLEALTPAERLAFVLHDVFGVPFADIAASRDGDFDALLEVLDPDVELRIDGGILRAEASLVLHGANAVAAHTATYSKLYPFLRPALVNGAAGAVVAPRGRVLSVMAFTVTNGKIVQIDALLDPERLVQLDLSLPPIADEHR